MTYINIEGLFMIKYEHTKKYVRGVLALANIIELGNRITKRNVGDLNAPDARVTDLAMRSLNYAKLKRSLNMKVNND